MTKQEAYDFLKDINIAVLATSFDNQPLASTMYYVVSPDLCVYFITENETKKYKHIQSNPNVSIVVTNREKVQTMQILGTAERVDDATTKINIIQQMSMANAQKNWLHWPPPISKIEAGEMVIIKVLPTWIRFADYLQEDLHDVFSQIDC